MHIRSANIQVIGDKSTFDEMAEVGDWMGRQELETPYVDSSRCENNWL